jgi:hypothetical protein
VGLAVPLGRQVAAGRVVALAGDEELLGGELGDHLGSGRGDEELLLDPRGTDAVGRRPVGLQGEDHPLLEHLRVVERGEPAEDGPLPDAQPEAVPVLQRESGLLVGEPELLRRRPDGDDVRRRGTRADQLDGTVHVLPADGVGVALGRRCAADGEGPVVAGPVAHVAVQDVEEGGVPRAQQPVGEHVGVWGAALPGDRVDSLDVLGAELVEHLVHEGDAVVLADAGAEELVEVLVGGVHHGGGVGEQADLVAGLDPARLEEGLLPVHDADAEVGEREHHWRLDDVDTQRLVLEAMVREHLVDLRGQVLSAACRGRDRTAQRGDAGAGAVVLAPLGGVGVVQPGRVQLVVLGCAAEVPQDGLPVPRQHGEADHLVHGPGADVRPGHVADVVEVEREQRPQLAAGELGLELVQALLAQPRHAQPVLPVDARRAVGR